VFGVISVVPTVATITLNVVMVAYVQQVLHRGATVYGVADMMYGVGALASGLLAAFVVIWLGEWATLMGLLASVVAGYLLLTQPEEWTRVRETVREAWARRKGT